MKNVVVSIPQVVAKLVLQHLTDERWILFSKMYLALLAGIAQDRGLLPDVDEPVHVRLPGTGFDDEHNAADAKQVAPSREVASREGK